MARLSTDHPDDFYLPATQALALAAFLVDRTGRDRGSDDELPPRPAESVASFVGLTPLEVCRTANREIGPVPELAKDVEEAMRSLRQREERLVAVERDGASRLNLAHVSIPGLVLKKADFSGFDFTKADLRRLRVWDARLVRASLAGADLSAAHLFGADLRRADMRWVNLTAATLVRADLRNADLGHVDVVSENLWKGARFPSRLVGAILMGADLRNADLGGADIRGASLEGARLDDANLGGADLSGADLYGAQGLTQQQLDGARARLDNPPTLSRVRHGNPPTVNRTLDAATNEPLVWRDASDGRSGNGAE